MGIKLKAEIISKFADSGELTTLEDLKVIMTRANSMLWPDGKKFTSKEGKQMIRYLFGVESSKELTRAQRDLLYLEFGNVLMGDSALNRDPEGNPIIVSNSM